MAGLNYSKLDNIVTPWTAPEYPQGWNKIKLSNVTIAHRQQLKMGMDDFTGFTWRGVDAFKVFGAFIINNKNSLKFYNGPTYSNEYTKPMFESAAGQLTGVTFSQQKIDFTIGIYWISEEHYRQLIYWLHPYVIDSLTFDFEQDWYYQVKLASVENGNRYIVGTEIIDGKKVYMYYTEMKITFEVQGPNCIYRKEMYEFKNESGKLFYIDPEGHTSFNTNLPTSFQVTFDINLSDPSFDPRINTEGTYTVSLRYSDTNETDDYGILLRSKKLFDITLKHLTYRGGTFSIKYDSETGLCFWNHADSEYHLLTRLSTLTTGKRFADSIESKTYMTEGAFDNPDFDITTQLYFQFSDTGNARQNTKFIMRARSNII